MNGNAKTFVSREKVNPFQAIPRSCLRTAKLCNASSTAFDSSWSCGAPVRSSNLSKSVASRVLTRAPSRTSSVSKTVEVYWLSQKNGRWEFSPATASPSEDHNNDEKAPRSKGRIGENPRRCKTALISERMVPHWSGSANRVNLVQGIQDILNSHTPLCRANYK